MWRVAAKDDVVPLSEPIIGVDGTAIHEIPIQAGQAIIVSVCGYNRSVSPNGCSGTHR